MVTEVVKRPKTYKPAAFTEQQLSRYARTAAAAKIDVSFLLQQRFHIFLNKYDIPVFNLDEVVKYMDAKAAAENEHRGWLWRPLRKQDWVDRVWFGERMRAGPYSDYYSQDRCRVYDKPVPLRVLKKVALIERQFGDEVLLFVSDYAAADPDPFLMAGVLVNGVISRYVIDFWDEPGFGLGQQLK